MMKLNYEFPNRAVFAIISVVLSYYILTARQSISMARALWYAQFWYMLLFGALLLYAYFRYTVLVRRCIPYTEDMQSLFAFVFLRLLMMVWLPQFLLVVLMRFLFDFLELDFEQSGYMDTEFFIVLLVFYSTALGGIALDFYTKLKEMKVISPALVENGIAQRHVEQQVILEKEGLSPEGESMDEELTPIKEAIHTRVEELLREVVVVRVRKNDVVFFKKDGTCEVNLDERDVVDTLVEHERMITINRWTTVNRTFIKSIKKIDENSERIVLEAKLERVYATCKTFNEPYFKDMENPKSILFIGRTYKKNVNALLKIKKGN